MLLLLLRAARVCRRLAVVQRWVDPDIGQFLESGATAEDGLRGGGTLRLRSTCIFAALGFGRCSEARFHGARCHGRSRWGGALAFPQCRELARHNVPLRCSPPPRLCATAGAGLGRQAGGTAGLLHRSIGTKEASTAQAPHVGPLLFVKALRARRLWDSPSLEHCAAATGSQPAVVGWHAWRRRALCWSLRVLRTAVRS